MHLAAPAFSPKMTPLVVGCEAWNGSANRLPTSHLPRPEKSVAAAAPDLKALGNPATAAGESPAAPNLLTLQSFQRGTSTPTPTPLSSAGSQSSVNADHEPKNPLADDVSVPIMLAKPEYCDWHRPAFTAECIDTTETGSYYGLDSKKNPYPALDPRGNRQLSGGKLNTTFELSYDDQSKTLRATVRVMLVPVDLHKCDAYGKVLPGADGQPESIPYYHDSHWKVVGRGVDSPVDGYVLKYRKANGANFDIATRTQQIEAVLNGHKSKLILNGCSKNAACGCRVSVVFKVELMLGVNQVPVDGKSAHKTINLFPKTQRADSGSWGEVNMYPAMQPGGKSTWKDMPYDTNVIAHECGHLFNYPDEYWEYGGFVNEQYIVNQELNFPLGDANKNKETWQIYSAKNLMGGGCNNRIETGDKAVPSATVHPYYLEYVRRHFCELTGETPQFTNGDKSKPVWRRWRVGYDA
jgi:type VI secretion system secreted protein VgrG